MFKKKVINGYGITRIQYTTLRLCVGKSNNVFIHRHYPFHGITYFSYSMEGFPFNFMIQCGKLAIHKFKFGLYFQGTEKQPYRSFKVVWGRFFIGSDTPKFLQNYGAKRFKEEHNQYLKQTGC